MQREVTEQDLRMPEFRYAKLEDLEFREDGKIVRKDRWERGIQSIRCLVYDRREWEISDVAEGVRRLEARDRKRTERRQRAVRLKA
jgi:hypothetical protein